MKTAISIPDALFRQAERLAKAQRISRSELYVRALTRLLKEQPKLSLTQAYDDAFEGAAQNRDDVALAASRAALLAVEWEEP